jgi:hypothetical protein
MSFILTNTYFTLTKYLPSITSTRTVTRSYDSISFIYRIDIQAYFSPTILTDKTMGGARIKKNNNGVMVDRKCTRHYRCPFGKFGECGEVHPSLADLDHLSLALTLVDRTGCLPLEGFPRLRAVLDEVGRASAVETTIVAVSLVGWRKARPRTLLWLLLNLWHRWSVESCLLGGSGYPSARQIASRRGSRSSAQD